MIMAGDGKKKLASIIVARMGDRGEDMKASNEEAFNKRAGEPESEEVDEGLLAAAEEVKAAMAKEPKDLAMALKNFFYLCDAEPHVEGEHEEEPHPILG